MPGRLPTVGALLRQFSRLDVVPEYGNSFFQIPQAERNAVLLRAMANPVNPPSGKIVYGHFFPIKYIGALPERMDQRRLRS